MEPNNDNGTTATGQTNTPGEEGGQSSATGSEHDSQQPQGGEGGKGQGSEANAGKDGKPEGEGAGDGKEESSESKEGGESEGAPESYEAFTLPEGWTLEGERLESFLTLAKRANLTQAEAQAEIDRFVQGAGEALGSRASQQVEAWGQQLKDDPEFGGAGFEANLKAAGAAAAEFGGEQFVKDLDTYGLGNLPSLNKAFLAAHKTIDALRKEVAELKAEGSLPGVGSASSGAPKSIAERMYPGGAK